MVRDCVGWRAMVLVGAGQCDIVKDVRNDAELCVVQECGIVLEHADTSDTL